MLYFTTETISKHKQNNSKKAGTKIQKLKRFQEFPTFFKWFKFSYCSWQSWPHLEWSLLAIRILFRSETYWRHFFYKKIQPALSSAKDNEEIKYVPPRHVLFLIVLMTEMILVQVWQDYKRRSCNSSSFQCIKFSYLECC